MSRAIAARKIGGEKTGTMTFTSSHPAKFVTGSTMRHVIVMTATGSVGLVAIFIVDALNLFYISLLGIQSLAAAVGFAATLLFFTISFAIGFTIACSALVSRALGRGDRPEAARLAGASMVFMALVTAAVTLAIWPFLHELLALLGATGETLTLSARFLDIVIPSTPIVALGMCTTGILRGVGDARRAMYVTLGGGIAAAILDPILIFGLKLGLEGAAISTVLSRCVLLAIGIYGAHYVHRLIALPDWKRLVAAARPFFSIGLPALATQIATPVGNAFVTAEIARFGDDAVAGWTIIGRIIPVAFGVIFSLSGAVGPIIGQNFGARRFDRLTQTMRDSLTVTIVYVLAVWALLALLSVPIASLFGATGLARELVIFFCVFVAGCFVFDGAIFVSSAAFNNLGYPTYSTVFNWARSTLGIIPFAWVGAHYFGANGVLAGRGLGAVIFGVVSMAVCFRTLAGIRERALPKKEEASPPLPPAANSPFSTGKAATLP
ncbi:MATE family efflux transporter [Mesorhizobium sp. BAC0120]|uniref:MATE family efflux transporter n=1 Tax=Mesorhizobium sp. BAC0120 TaxID=3090670 RepID=UPI00298BFFBF|nr:MATE family efflux transporter [Mesorhizobium sp. BAC0120]MDW6024099.1 MATE family efflux transporter [Mesorhizobium sp. BAC0120]